ncbi:protein translocase subunit SecF [Suttonella ornithocola]|uniref:Protein-export membrane protein SecF n=1 Tax=Suttonella ornithocola TaxID=279832 RepID=A0A380MUG5_9GAMM|nr:protein translocase subunit SecF [Suttonella ornithocola]SUO95563.1 preprotein translocase subunit SecF [Suttonella ornithocola]
MRIRLPQLHFMKYSHHGLYFSLILTIVSILLIIFRGFNFGLEFTGGATIELQFAQTVSIPDIRAEVVKVNPNATVIQYGSSKDVQISFGEKKGEDTDELMNDIVSAVKASHPDVKLMGQSKIGGQYKSELIEKGITALALSCIGLIIYLGLRFEWKFAIGAVAAQLHDVIVTAGIFSLTQWTFDLNVLAALLAILGYSVNDTVVVYDRIRENLRALPAVAPNDVIDMSINQTMARTIVTSFTTFLAVLALLLFGGETLFGFAAAMIFGIAFGTYSSVFVASALVSNMHLKHEDLIPKSKQQLDDLP